jgi:phosphate acetyltransferase
MKPCWQASRTWRRLSHVFRFDVPMYEKPLLITDAALNIRPTLEEKVDIIQNAINLSLAFDNAVSMEAARIKGITSTVAGNADILMVPDLESGNVLAKQLEYLAGATACGVVLGARVPIALTSRADGPNARVASAALALLLAHRNRERQP